MSRRSATPAQASGRNATGTRACQRVNVAGREAIYVAGAGADHVALVDPETFEELERVELAATAPEAPSHAGPRGVTLALASDERTLYVGGAVPGVLGVVRLGAPVARVAAQVPRVAAQVPVGRSTVALALSRDGRTLAVGGGRGPGRTVLLAAPPPAR